MGISFQEWTARLSRLFEEEYLKPGLVKDLAARTGISVSRFYGDRQVAQETIFLVHERLGHDIHGLLQRALGVNENPRQAFLRRELSPAHLLLLQSEPATLAPGDPFLATLDHLCDQALGPSPQGPLIATLRPKLLLLEDERLRNRRRAKRHLEAMARRLGNQMAKRPTRGRLADLAAVLTSWAAVQRVAGRRNEAILALGRAWELVERVDEPWTTGFWYQKGGYLLQDLAQPELAHEFALRSAIAFGEGSHTLEVAQTLVDRAITQYYLGRKQEAVRLFECAIEALPRSATIYRCAAHVNLAQALRELGDLKAAARHLEHTAELTAPDTVELGHLRWKQAGLAVALKRQDEAFARFQEAMGIIGSSGEAVDLIFIALDYAEALVCFHRQKDARFLAQEIAKSARLFSGSVRMRRISEDLRAMIALGDINLEFVKKARVRLTKAGHKPIATPTGEKPG